MPEEQKMKTIKMGEEFILETPWGPVKAYIDRDSRSGLNVYTYNERFDMWGVPDVQKRHRKEREQWVKDGTLVKDHLKEEEER